MPMIVRLFSVLVVLATLAGCSGAPVPANYYENDLHHGYPGPAVTDPSAI